MIQGMESPAAELLNALRSAVFAKDGRKEMLDGIDAVESVVQSMQRQLECEHERLADKEREKAEFVVRLKASEEKNSLLEEKLRLAMARMFGRSSERWKPDETRQALLFNEIEMIRREEGAQAIGDATPTADVPDVARHLRRQKNHDPQDALGHGGRSPLPESLPRREIRLDEGDGVRTCPACGKDLVRIGEDVSERLCIEPVKYYVERTVRTTWGCSCGQGGMHAAPVPRHLVPKSVASPSLLAHIVTAKFCDALPFYRQANMFGRDGIDISRATMARWAQEAHELLSPLTDLIRSKIRTSPVMNMDETRVRVLHENGTVKEGLSWMWVAAASVALLEAEADGRRDIKLVTFHYAPGRDHEVAEELLAGFSGTLMSDAYTAYNGPTRNAGIVQAACMAHVRRKFHDVLKVEKGNQKAQVALGYIKALYDIEAAEADSPPDMRLKVRQEKSRPIMDAFWKWLVAEARQVPPQSTLGRAINYTIPLWPRLEVFLDNGRVPIDNNLAENAIRPFAVGRRNWLFFDQSTGAEASTSFYTIMESARANDVEPMHYLRFLFNCIERFAPDAMPWEKLLPLPSIRYFAESAGIPYSMDC